jgi:hypothetical protein
MKMNVIATSVSAWVFEPIFSSLDDGRKMIHGYSKSPVIAWRICTGMHPYPITCEGEPEGHWMLRFGEKEDFEGLMYIPYRLQVLTPWVVQEDGRRALEGVSKDRIIAKFQELIDADSKSIGGLGSTGV